MSRTSSSLVDPLRDTGTWYAPTLSTHKERSGHKTGNGTSVTETTTTRPRPTLCYTDPTPSVIGVSALHGSSVGSSSSLLTRPPRVPTCLFVDVDEGPTHRPWRYPPDPDGIGL